MHDATDTRFAAGTGSVATPYGAHFTPQEIAELWKLDPNTIRRIFQDEPGVLKIGAAGRRLKRDYVTLRIPAAVVERVWRERTR